MGDDLSFDFEPGLAASNLLTNQDNADARALDLPAEDIGQPHGNFKKNFRQTVCTYWLRGLCMKGDQCGFLHQYDQDRMPVCRALVKTGKCTELDCPYKHDLEEIKECNMFKLGFCIYGPQCRYKHKKLPGPPPEPSTVEAAKPKEYRDMSRILSQSGMGDERAFKRPRPGFYRGFTGPGAFGALPGQAGAAPGAQPGAMLALPAPGGAPGAAGTTAGGGGGAEGAATGAGVGPGSLDMPPVLPGMPPIANVPVDLNVPATMNPMFAAFAEMMQRELGLQFNPLNLPAAGGG